MKSNRAATLDKARGRKKKNNELDAAAASFNLQPTDAATQDEPPAEPQTLGDTFNNPKGGELYKSRAAEPSASATPPAAPAPILSPAPATETEPLTPPIIPPPPIAVPKKQKETSQILIRIEPRVKDILTAQAAERGYTLNGYLRYILNKVANV